MASLIRRFAYKAAVLPLLVLGACTTLNQDDTSFGVPLRDINAMPVGKATAAISDWTFMSFDPGSSYCIGGKFISCTSVPGHGTQVSYITTKNTALLWYPGNSRPVFSRWRLVRDGDIYDICYTFQRNSYNPLTKTRGGTEECRSLGRLVHKIVETRRGDIFNLSSGRLPYRLSSDRTTFDELLARRQSK